MSLIARARAAARRQMTDTVVITRTAVGQGPYDPVTKRHEALPSQTVYSGPARLKNGVTLDTETLVALATQNVSRWELQVPVAGTETVTGGDVATVLTSRYDASLPAVAFTISSAAGGTQTSARRFVVERIS